ncbi:MAG: hypothetical protein HYZ96_02310 [Candidatus Omnitrophica bacterium]|nr:hypothetical protein [Candidatus Omnitrophota bacterium]
MVYAVAEDISLTTYYPSPRGVYQDLRVTDNFLFADADGTPPLPGQALVAVDATGAAVWSGYSLPAGMIAIFDTPCPADWTQIWADGRTLRGAAGFGGTGGSDDHVHTFAIPTANFAHTHRMDPPQFDDSGFAKDHPSAQHDHSVDIAHNHSFGGLTGGADGGNLGADCDNDQCDNPILAHGHGYGGTTSTDGGTPTTDGAGSHVHNVDVDLDEFWTLDTTIPPDGEVNGTTDLEVSWPPYRDVVFCKKNP